MISFILIYLNLVLGIGPVAADVPVSAKPPEGASQVIDHAFAGVAMKSLIYVQETTIDTLYPKRDHTIYDLNQKKAIEIQQGHHDGLKVNNTLGQQWFDTFDRLGNVSFILQFGFARDHGKNYTEAVGYIQNVLNKIGGCNSPRFQAVELGNEPNLYVGQEVRSKGYELEDYIHESAGSIHVLRRNISCLNEGRKFQVFQKSSRLIQEGWSTRLFDFRANFMHKAPKIIDFKHVKSVAQHLTA
ncbi:hypothetical protein BGZ63DRAFT_405554 [Mariannaea sp. PMI_226]|nr:hypothetical protein BGZ63DRAFT_405554 [Mariannaea sp. PMI_226]